MQKPLYCCPEYMVDDDGFVVSKRGKPLKPSLNHNGYEIINVMIDGHRKGMSVHGAVAHTYLDGYEDGMQVNHKDGNKRNNSVANLEWVTAAENTRHSIDVLGNDKSGEKSSNAKPVYGFDKNTGELKFSFPSQIDAGRIFSSGNETKAKYIAGTISSVIHGRKKSYRGCVWQNTPEWRKW